MAHNVIMPKAGMAMEEGTIVRWLKVVGDPVRKGEPLAVIETDKVTMDLESDFEGTLVSIVHGDGSVVKATDTIAWIGEPGEEVVTTSEAPAAAPAPVSEASRPTTGAPAPRTLPATPVARAQATAAGIDLSLVAGTGPGGAVRVRDLPLASTAARLTVGGQAPATGGLAPAAAMVTRVDITELSSLLARARGAGGRQISCADFVVRAAAAALGDYPAVNSLRRGDSSVPQEEVNIGIPVAAEHGAAVVVVRNADRLTLRQIADASRDASERARLGALTPQDGAGATFLVIDLAAHGITAFSPVILGPQCAALGVGAAEQVLKMGPAGVECREFMNLCLTRDPRHLSDWAAALFLSRVRSLLENCCLLLA